MSVSTLAAQGDWAVMPATKAGLMWLQADLEGNIKDVRVDMANMGRGLTSEINRQARPLGGGDTGSTGWDRQVGGVDGLDGRRDGHDPRRSDNPFPVSVLERAAQEREEGIRRLDRRDTRGGQDTGCLRSVAFLYVNLCLLL